MPKDTAILARNLKELLEVNIPQQFVSSVGLSIIEKFCQKLSLPAPSVLGGNVLIGDVKSCDFLLTAHLDELSFGFKKLESGGGWLAPYHKYSLSKETQELTIMGIRNRTIVEVGRGKLIARNSQPYCDTSFPLLPGDRAVYFYNTQISGSLVTGKAIDDRAGVLIVLLAAQMLLNQGAAVAVVLSDGEEQIPEGYFSRNFPHVLSILKKDCTICFVDGIYRDGLEPLGYTGLTKSALVIPHSSYGKGYIVPPFVFAWLRDEIIPKAKQRRIDVELCSAYRSRGDEWGLVTNPVSGRDYQCFFVDFSAWGEAGHETPLTIDIEAIQNCVDFIAFAVEEKLRQ